MVSRASAADHEPAVSAIIANTVAISASVKPQRSLNAASRYSALLQVVEFLKFANYFQLVENIDKDILSILDSKNTKSTTCKRALY